MKETVQEAAKRICKSWGMEDNHGYGVKDTFLVGFVKGAQWQAKQSPWISVDEREPEEGTGVFFIVEWGKNRHGYYVGVYNGNGCWEYDHWIFSPDSELGKVISWMPIPKFNE